jgi:hypothetical protein
MVAPIASAAIAGSAAGLAGLALFALWRSLPRRQRAFSREELEALAPDAEDWLLDRRALIPPEAGAALDAMLTCLGELTPHLARLDPNSTMAWEARRLIGRHLPGLVEPWCELPAGTRERDWEARRRLTDALETLAREIGHLLDETSRDRREALETHGRFVETRYGAFSGRRLDPRRY